MRENRPAVPGHEVSRYAN